MRKKQLFITLSLLCAAAQLPAQGIRDQYGSKAEACEVTDSYNYRKSDGYKQYGQIGWEKEVAWRPIQYLDRYETEHRAYNINSFFYCQVMSGNKVLDDCEIVAVNGDGLIVGNQCPEPKPLKAQNADNTAIMAIFGSLPGEEIKFKVVTGTGTDADPLVEQWAEETHAFVPNGITGLTDEDGDGRPDTWAPVVLHIGSSDIPNGISSVKTEGSTTIDIINGTRLDTPKKGVNIIRKGEKSRKVVVR